MTGYVLPPPVAGLEPTLPSSWYRSEKVFGLEKERIFFREWLCVGREEELPSPGSHRVLDVLGESVILVRNRENQLRAFYNVFSHRRRHRRRPHRLPLPPMDVRPRRPPPRRPLPDY